VLDMKCTIHNIRFSAEELPEGHKDDRGYIDCPYCSHIERVRLRAELKEIKKHRDLLLGAIELKLLYTVYTEDF